jgi:hypothetical protein
MTEHVVGRQPAAGAVVAEQMRAVGLATRRELLAVAGLLVLLLLTLSVIGLMPSIRVQVDADLPLILNPEDLGYLALMVGVVFPLAVWKGETPFGDTQLWSLPVDRPRHALVKVGAGWAWLMGLVAVGLLFLCAGILVSGGYLGVGGTRLLIVDPAAGTTAATPWSTPWWQWVLPFTAASTAYLFATALVLGTEHPWRWAAAAWFLFVAVGVVAEEGGIVWLEGAFRFVFLEGFDFVASSGVETLRGRVQVPGDRPIFGWYGLPTLGRWASVTAGWMGVGLMGVWVAAARHREG